MKQCKHCLGLKHKSKFSHDHRNSDGRCSYCKRCSSKLCKVWRKQNPDYDKNRHHADPAPQMLKGARKRAKNRGRIFTITAQDIVVPTRCPVLGIPIIVGHKYITDNSPTLDRINTDHGYIPENVAVISHRANTIKSKGTSEEHFKIYQWMRGQNVTQALPT